MYTVPYSCRYIKNLFVQKNLPKYSRQKTTFNNVLDRMKIIVVVDTTYMSDMQLWKESLKKNQAWQYGIQTLNDLCNTGILEVIGFDSHTGLIFFQAFFSQLHKLCL